MGCIFCLYLILSVFGLLATVMRGFALRNKDAFKANTDPFSLTVLVDKYTHVVYMPAGAVE